MQSLQAPALEIKGPSWSDEQSHAPERHRISARESKSVIGFQAYASGEVKAHPAGITAMVPRICLARQIRIPKPKVFFLHCGLKKL